MANAADHYGPYLGCGGTDRRPGTIMSSFAVMPATAHPPVPVRKRVAATAANLPAALGLSHRKAAGAPTANPRTAPRG
jgi:hypothetical protein